MGGSHYIAFRHETADRCPRPWRERLPTFQSARRAGRRPPANYRITFKPSNTRNPRRGIRGISRRADASSFSGTKGPIPANGALLLFSRPLVLEPESDIAHSKGI